MTPVELCDPLFRYICRLNRSVNAGVAPDMSRVRTELKQLLDQIANEASKDPALRDQFDISGKGKLNQVLVYFVDSTIADSDFPFALEWERLELERYGELVGDQRFWVYLDETLADNSESATDRLAVFYQCVGLGFTGLYAGQPEYLRSKMNQIAERIGKSYLPSETSGTVCPEAYQFTDKSNLIEPPAPRMIGVAIAVAGLILTLFVANVYLYNQAKGDLAEALQTINAMGSAQAEQDTPSP